MSSTSSCLTGDQTEDVTNTAMKNDSPPNNLLSLDEDRTPSSNLMSESASSDEGEISRRKRSKKSSASSSTQGISNSKASRRAAKQSKFILKVYEMASCEEHQHAMGFSEDGLALEVRDMLALGPILSRYFKHGNPSSFVRQLNNYGFKTITPTVLNGNIHVYAHPSFKRDDSSLLETITRKSAVCVKKKSKGEIIRDLQQKNQDQQAQIQQMETRHLEMFHRLMALESENKNLRVHLEYLRRSFQEATTRMDFSAVEGTTDLLPHVRSPPPPPPPRPAGYQTHRPHPQFAPIVHPPQNQQSNYQHPPRHQTNRSVSSYQMYDRVGNPVHPPASEGPPARMSYPPPPLMEAPPHPHDRDGINGFESFHLD